MSFAGISPSPETRSTAHGPRPLIVGIDIGGTKVAALVIDREGQILARDVVPLGVASSDRASEVVAGIVGRTLAKAGATLVDVEAIGIGVPGRVDPVAGTVTSAVNLGWFELRLGHEVESRLGRPCVLENDVRAAAIGLHQRLGLENCDDLAYIAVGTGVSAGIILGGRLHRGIRGMAGEIGHVIADAAGPRCTCGATGCLEALISGPAIAREAREAVARGEPSRLPRGTALTAVDVYRAAADGDELCAAIVREVGRRIAWAIHLVVMTYDVKRVVLGGGVSQAGETFLRPIERELDRLRQSSELARDQLAPEMVVLLPAGADAGAWGAVTIANLAGVEANRHRA